MKSNLEGGRVILLVIALMGIFLARPSFAATATKTPRILHGVINVEGLDRTYLYYLPQNLPSNAPVVFVLHGSTENGREMRSVTGYGFERQADEHGFIVVYPDGYHRHWNDCRKAASYAAKKKNIDDEEFILALINYFHVAFNADTGRVFTMGYSNGGQMAYRLALEMPERITAVAAVAANLPTSDNCDCYQGNHPVPVMIMNGTRDPINPYKGGSVTIFGFGNRGTVLSSRKTAEYFAKLNQQDGPPKIASPARSVERMDWNAPGKPEVVLESIKGGGHVVPQPYHRALLLLGRTVRTINGPAEIWNFFARQTPLQFAELRSDKE